MIITFIFYLVFLVIFVVFSVFVLYHLIKYNFGGIITKIMTILFLIGVVVILIITLIFLGRRDIKFYPSSQEINTGLQIKK